MKMCTKCKKMVCKINFIKDKTKKDGLYSSCKIHTKNRIFKQTKEEKKEYDKNRYLKNRDKIIKQTRKYYEKNKKDIFEYYANRLRNDLDFRLKKRIRDRVYKAIKYKGNRKKYSISKDLGCSIKELKKHLESQFQKGMTWDNYGEWHIDHVIPLSKLDLQNKDEFKKACHYTNLQPLWAEDNLRKGNKHESH